jgi:hypothetical protein
MQATKRNMDRLKALRRCCFVGTIAASLLCIAAVAIAQTATAPAAIVQAQAVSKGGNYGCY